MFLDYPGRHLAHIAKAASHPTCSGERPVSMPSKPQSLAGSSQSRLVARSRPLIRSPRSELPRSCELPQQSSLKITPCVRAHHNQAAHSSIDLAQPNERATSEEHAHKAVLEIVQKAPDHPDPVTGKLGQSRLHVSEQRHVAPGDHHCVTNRHGDLPGIATARGQIDDRQVK